MQRVDIRFDDESVQRLLKAVEAKAEAFREEGRGEVRFEVQEEIDRAIRDDVNTAVPITALREALDRAGQES